VPRGTQDPHRASCCFAYRAVTVYGRPFQSVLLHHSVPYLGPTTPTLERKRQKKGKGRGKGKVFSVPVPMPVPVSFVLGSVWALPPSLAATEGISLDFSSSGY
jgi:hypothetical protein